MVRQLKTGKQSLEELEEVTEEQIKKYNDTRKAVFKDELNAGYFFSVVFDTNAERDLWLKERGLSLVEGFFIKAKDFVF